MRSGLTPLKIGVLVTDQRCAVGGVYGIIDLLYNLQEGFRFLKKNIFL